jgi:hypothetical protein
MRFYQILPVAIEQGKKIRYRDWVSQVYIQWERCSSSFLNDKGYDFHFTSKLLESDGWEIYEEPKKVADFYVFSGITSASGEKYFTVKTREVGPESEGLVMVPGTEREI